MRTQSAAHRRRAARSGEQPAGDNPRDERNGNLEEEPDDERRRRDEDREGSAVDDALEVLLERERRDRDQREDMRRRSGASPADTAQDDPDERQQQKNLGGVPHIGVEALGRRRRDPIRERVRDENPGRKHRREHEPRSSAVHTAMIRVAPEASGVYWVNAARATGAQRTENSGFTSSARAYQ